MLRGRGAPSARTCGVRTRPPDSGEVVACDGRCEKAWGINGRPKVDLSDVADDCAWVPDQNLRNAPGPGQTAILSEGGHLKPNPSNAAWKLQSKWCLRECERSVWVKPGELPALPDFTRPLQNIPEEERRSRQLPVVNVGRLVRRWVEEHPEEGVAEWIIRLRLDDWTGYV